LLEPLRLSQVGEWEFTLQPCDDQSARNTTWREGGQDGNYLNQKLEVKIIWIKRCSWG